jgi:sugar transferase (PEP-CTERM/EpsH1 system associated)
LSVGCHNFAKEGELAAGGISLTHSILETMDTVLQATNELSSTIGHDASLVSARGQIRVLHVVNRLDLGGTESGILKVAAGLGGEDFSHAVCTGRGHSAEFAEQRTFSGSVFDVAGPSTSSQFLVFRFLRIIRRYRPHIVHSRNWGAIEAVFAARLAGVLGIIHSEHGYELDMLTGLPLRKRLIRRAAYAAADSIFTVTSDLRDYHARQAGISSLGIDVIANGVDSDHFAPRPQMKSICRARLGLPDNSLLIGTVGRLVAIKDQALLLRAVKILVDRGLSLSVSLAGDGPEREPLRALAAALALTDRVRFLGASNNVADFLNAIDIFVLPSVSEGMSNTLLEAMSSGLPVVATSVGGNPELIEDQISGRLFQVGDVNKLVEHLSSLADDLELRRTLGATARARVLASFRLSTMLDRTVGVQAT